MINIHCSICQRTLYQQGGLVFGPPRDDKTVVKMHVCVTCSDLLFAWMDKMREVINLPPVVRERCGDEGVVGEGECLLPKGHAGRHMYGRIA